MVAFLTSSVAPSGNNSLIFKIVDWNEACCHIVMFSGSCAMVEKKELGSTCMNISIVLAA